MSIFPEFHQYDGLGLAELVRKKEVTAAELVEEAIQRIETHNPRLNAVVYKMYDSARETAKKPLPDGPFAGAPFLVKDLLAAIEGIPTSCGTRLLKNTPMPHDSEMVKRWKKAGVIILGKSNTPEFGLTPFTESEALGAAHNPWDLARTPGGSSGGSGAAVAARMVPLASGGDGGGSIRIPSSACGIFGLKPTRGRTPSGPDIGEAWHGFAIEHVLTRSVRDSAAMLDATAGSDVGAPYVISGAEIPFSEAVKQAPGRLKIAFSGKPMLGKRVDAEVLTGLDQTVHLLKGLGHEVFESAPQIDGEAFSLAFMSILAGEVRADIEAAAKSAGKKVSPDDFDPVTFGLGLIGKILTAADYAAAARYLQSTAREIGRFFEGCDVLLTPTLSRPPAKIGELQPTASEQSLIKMLGRLNAGWVLDALGTIKPLAAQTYEFLPWTPVFNVTGQPAMSVPLHWTESGLPVGMHFVGKFGDEATLFRLAGQLEQAKPWFDRSPQGF
ncbi:MAG: amidase [Chloroflexi bacterium]|nr:MAG: amidase [Chloroflexota bacterium]